MTLRDVHGAPIEGGRSAPPNDGWERFATEEEPWRPLLGRLPAFAIAVMLGAIVGGLIILAFKLGHAVGAAPCPRPADCPHHAPLR